MPITRTNINKFSFEYENESGPQEAELVFTGHEVISPQMTPIYATLGDSYEKVRTDLKVHHKQYTGPLTEDERELVYKMVEAESVYWVGDSSTHLITILDIDFDEELPKTEPTGLMFEWIVADENLRDV